MPFLELVTLQKVSFELSRNDYPKIINNPY